MNDDVYRQLAGLQKQIDNLVKPEVGTAADGAAKAIALFQLIPGLVGLWVMSNPQRSTGNLADISGHGRTLTYNGNPTYNIYNDLAPYIDLDGTGDFLSRADETDIDILGTETIYASGVRGLTMGGWFWIDALSGGAAKGFINKYITTGNQRSYTLVLDTTDQAGFIISSNGTATTGVASAAALATGQWYFIVARFVPSTSLDLYINGVKATNTTSIPASIFNSTSALEIGRFNGTGALDGRATFVFLSANALPEALITRLYRQSKGLLGL